MRVQLIKNGKKVTAFVPVRTLSFYPMSCGVGGLELIGLDNRMMVASTSSMRTTKSSFLVSVVVVRPRVIFPVFASRL